MAKRSQSFLSLLVVFSLGLLIRLVLIPQAGFEADIAYWKWWADEAAQHGAAAMIAGTGINYPPFFAFILEVIGRLYYLLGGTKDNLFNANNLLFLFLAKILPILADLATAFLIYRLCKDVILREAKDPVKNSFSLLTTTLYLFNPVVIFDSSYWGQTDSIAAFLTLLFFYLFLKERVFLAFAIAAISLFTKVQTVIFIPILVLLTLKINGVKKLVEGAFVFTITAYIINLPYILARIMPRVLSMVIDSASYFPLASLNAYNIWWIIARGAGFTTSDQTVIGSLITYKALGLLLFGLIYLLTCVYLWKNLVRGDAYKAGDAVRSHINPSTGWRTHQNFEFCIFNFKLIKPLLLTCALIAFGFYMLPTEIHERYIYPIFMFIILLSPYFYRTKYFILYALYLILLTLSIFINLHLVLVLNYPDNGLPLFSIFNQPPFYLPLTMILSIINLILFIAFVVYIFRRLSKGIILSFFGIPVVLITLLAVKNLIGSDKNPINLADIKPVVARQDYGTLQKNRSVDIRNLSSAYYYYSKGLGTHANSYIVYNLNGKYKRLITDFGVDTEAADNASVEFVILLDKKVLLKTPIMKKWNTPGHVDFDITNGKTLELIITDAGDGRNGDHADWLQPKLYR